MAGRNRHRWYRSGAVAAATAGVMLLGTGTASAETKTTAKVVDLTYDVLQSNRIPAITATGAAQQKVQHFLEREARAGRLVSIESLDIISVDLGAGGAVGAVLARSDALHDMRVVLVGDNQDSPAFIGAIFADEREADALSGVTPGYDGGVNTDGMTRTNEACRDLWFDAAYPTYNNGDHHVYDCWEKWRDKRDGFQWAYNRYTLFDPALGWGGYKGQMIDATIRSRPWRGYETRVSGGPYNYHPKPTESCTTYNATIPFPSGSSLQVPYVLCGPELSVLPNAALHSFGVDWNGRTTAQLYLDGTFRMTAPKPPSLPDDIHVTRVAAGTSGAPIYADYIWMEVQYCNGHGNCSAFNPSDYERWTDKGW